MLVLSRVVGDSIIVLAAEGTVVMTVVELRHAAKSIVARVGWLAGDEEPKLVELARDNRVALGLKVELMLFDLRDNKARIGVMAPADAHVHRLEVYEQIQRENRAARRAQGGEDSLAGFAVQRPSGPRHPSLEVRLKEPESTE